jgi:AcrR family transcriptional regulator
MRYMKSNKKQRRPQADRDQLLDRCLAAFVKAGTLDLSLDKLAGMVGSSKRMLIHYFRGREPIEELAMTRLEERLREQFRADVLPKGITLHKVMTLLWEMTSRPEARGALLLVMNVTQRAWSGSKRAREFYRRQQRLWSDMLLAFCSDRLTVEAVLQLFQGATLTYLVTGDRKPGLRAIERFFKAKTRR